MVYQVEILEFANTVALDPNSSRTKRAEKYGAVLVEGD